MLEFTVGSGRSKVDISSVFDVVIIGAGPSGLTAGLYAGRYRLKTLLIEKKLTCGGQLATINSVENYPGFNQPASGSQIAQRIEDQAVKSGTQILNASVESVDFSGPIKELRTPKGIIKTRAVIICTGAQPQKLNIPGEKEHLSKGVSYCATCDGNLYTDKTIAAVGGGNTALEETITLAQYAKKIFLIHRRDEFRADKILQERIRINPKIECVLNAVVKRINFEDVNKRNISLNKEGQEKTIAVDGIFIFVGIRPCSELFNDTLEVQDGFIITNERMETNVKGVFAAGDIRSKSLRQITTATADGSIAAFSAKNYLLEKKP